ncbi:CDGSH iron-sulfur domain-containing protein [Legionella spiritensis]|uniref:Glutamate synthetase n=1 Tax=Legionella spiritensis TaxID=452 RepID=A0A0W0YZG6_LEGSP|nr:CDGSH iron-sulfur domain-containing protein [Legionella spiritensis]KTD62031.1 glutamate synthetase [Legionella spiritensis]SNV34628.1 glutamate synthetase [Legionella spiritensis]VEG89646.1 glutamate synthetase [Legionella spiritensis]
MSHEPEDPPFFPIAFDVEAGKEYRWCGCGLSTNQPFCDRDNCGEKSVPYKAILTETVYFCGCRHTKDPPLCDGSHARLLMAFMKNRKN